MVGFGNFSFDEEFFRTDSAVLVSRQGAQWRIHMGSSGKGMHTILSAKEKEEATLQLDMRLVRLDSAFSTLNCTMYV